jgi:hypothetical protein
VDGSRLEAAPPGRSNEAATVAAARREGLICAYFKKPFLHEEILQVIEDFAAPEPRREEAASCQ